MPQDIGDSLDCSRLTVLESKLALFRVEAGDYLARGLAAARHALGSELPEVLSRLAVLVVQPDAIARRQVDLCISYVRQHGFAPMLAVPFVLDVAMARVLWQFQFNAITDDSKAIGEGVYCRGPSLMLALKDDRPSEGTPASTRLAGLKGSSEPARRTPGCLRSTLGAINRVFGSVHCPDEPLDILREAAIVFDSQRLTYLYRQLGGAFASGVAHDLRPAIASVYEASPEHDVNVERATRRLLAAIDHAGRRGEDGARIARVLAATVDRARRRAVRMEWFDFAADLRALGIDPCDWDALLVGSHYVRYELPGAAKLIESFSGS